MALHRKYPDSFERMWAMYPMWPKGRSVKTDAFKAFQTVQKELGGWNDEDIGRILEAIETQKRERASWQLGHKHGPQGLQRWIRAHGWFAEYETVRDTKRRSAPSHREFQKEEEPRVVPTDEQIQERVRQLGDLRRMLH